MKLHTNNSLGQMIVTVFGEDNSRISYLNSENILWQIEGGEWIGKRSVWTHDFRACWLEHTSEENIKIYWCGGKDLDYKEIFKRV